MRARKRSGIAERMLYVIMFMALFQFSGAALNSLALFTNPGGIGTGAAGQISSLTQQIGCSTYTVGTTAGTCKQNVGGIASTVPNLLIFGDWPALLQSIAIFGWVLINPFGFLAAFGVASVIIAIFSGGIDILWLFLLGWIISGRPL